ncbi:helix-turn-helix transcriptional regulator [Eubacteriales bacterium OttesenSCG-928-N14]|nr:helix-turn-helix transcriptional regulator [Eubacteriales bacterium OttesenSCG-928-N14]
MPRDKKGIDGYLRPFAVRVRQLMEERKISQVVLAEHVGVTRQAVSQYANGTTLPDVEKLERIADFFDVSADYLLGRSDITKIHPSKQAVAEYLKLSEDAIDSIHDLQYGLLQQRFEDGFQMTAVDVPLVDVMSLLLESPNLEQILDGLYKAANTMAEYSVSGNHPERYTISEGQKQQIESLQDDGYVVLSLGEQLSFYRQAVMGEFEKATERILDEAMAVAIAYEQEQSSADDQ